MSNLQLQPIIRGTDWADLMTQWAVDGTVQDLSLYRFDCHFKSQQGTEQQVVIQPTLVLTAEGLRLSLTEVQTASLSTGVLHFNLLATRDGWTQEVVGGTVPVLAGVTHAV